MDQDFTIDDGLVERLHGLLAEALHRARPDPFNAPVTVAEIYQDLVPYRAVRTSLGFHMNADYEHTLLRLLAGEGDLARLDPPEARDELRSELDTPNPNVGLFRKFAACDVWVTAIAMTEALPELVIELPAPPVVPTPAAVPTSPAAATPAAPAVPTGQASPPPPEPVPPAPAPPPGAGAGEWDPAEWSALEAEASGTWDAAELLLEEEVDAPDTSAQAQAAVATTPPTEQPKAATMLETKKATAVADPSLGSCSFCNHGLPAGRVVHFCPYCGADQTMQPCSTCREPLEAGWKFCIACGTRQT